MYKRSSENSSHDLFFNSIVPPVNRVSPRGMYYHISDCSLALKTAFVRKTASISVCRFSDGLFGRYTIEKRNVVAITTRLGCQYTEQSLGVVQLLNWAQICSGCFNPYVCD